MTSVSKVSIIFTVYHKHTAELAGNAGVRNLKMVRLTATKVICVFYSRGSHGLVLLTMLYVTLIWVINQWSQLLKVALYLTVGFYGSNIHIFFNKPKNNVTFFKTLHLKLTTK